MIRSGSVREISDEEVVMKMIGELKKQIKDFDAEDYDHVYVFAPGQTKNKVKEALPAEFKKKIEGVIEGNYCSESPLLVLERISKNDNNGNKKVLPLKPEARKILKKSNQARKVIKGRADIAV